ncbi:MAG: nucleotidyltransferase domain-containing protein [Dethiobacter sp.]|jgi:predicted nucleotidyltransferase|nr:nucleotidyltransferase domain-containing protein [Dethiobacter sp.]MBS3902381.1 nucleotidyltransferase domain-containing protein [Dethiobacter sp.]MBS4008021.1 nucleotidyltransferase domain-containing protein [Clostridium sp.]
MDKDSVIALARQYSELVSKHLPVKQVVLYGSYANGAAGPDSDIDIAVIVEKLEEDYLDTHARLFKLRRSIDFRIEPVLIELGEDKSGFLRDILDKGYVLFSNS